jgi:hypothetical protein
MADEVAPVAPAPEPAAAVEVAAPVVEAPAPETPAVEAPASAIEGATEPEVPAAETPAAPAEGDTPEAPAEPTAAEAAPAEPTLPTYEAFTIPEGLEAPPAELLDEFTTTIGKAGLTQEQGQEMMNLHGKVMQKAVADLAQRQHDIFAETRAGWVREFAKENGNRRDTVLSDAKWGITQAFPNDAERTRVWEALRATGAGDHPAVIKAFAVLGSRLRERQAPSSPLPPKPSTNKADQRYGGRSASPVRT